VGIATQDPELRKKFTGKPEHVINFFFMLAEDVRLEFIIFPQDILIPNFLFRFVKSWLAWGFVIGPEVSDKQIYAAYAQAIDTGIAKVMAKMGISTLQSYKSAQIFEAVGLGTDLVAKCFRGTQSRIGGVTIPLIWNGAMNERLNN